MKAIIDEDLHRSLAKALQLIGFEAVDIRDYDLRGASDCHIYEFAQREKGILFSADLGFSNIRSFPLGTHFGIVILRFPNEMTTNDVNIQVKKLLKNVDKDGFKGNLLILSKDKIRIRRA